MQRLVLSIATAACLANFGIWVAAQQNPASQKTIAYLSGQWKDENAGLTVIMAQSGSAVSATFDKEPLKCDPQDGGPIQQTQSDFSGATLAGNQLRGSDLAACSFGKNNPLGTGIKRTAFQLTLSSDGNTLQGTFVDLLKGGNPSLAFSRVCNPDLNALCQAVGKAVGTITAAEQPPGSAALYQDLQQNLGAELAQIKPQLCKDKTGQQKLGALQNELDSLNYIAGQSNLLNNVNLYHIEKGLTDLNQTQCRAPVQGVCPQGQQKVKDEDDPAVKFIKDQFKEALDTVEKGIQQGGSAAQLKDLKDKYQEAVGFWNQIKAGSCLPSDVYQTMQEVARDRGAEGHSEDCPGMCTALKKWYESLIGKNDSLEGKEFEEYCLAHCD